MTSPLVSVVVPAFNAAGTIADTLASICNQTFHHIEVIVVDDGSTDATAQAALAVATRDSRVKLIRQHNQGIAAARNAGIAKASAEWVAVADADDLWHPAKIQRQMAIAMHQPSVALIYCNRREIDETGYLIRTPIPETLAGWAVHRMIAHNPVNNGSAILFKRRDALRQGGYDPLLRAGGAQGCEDFLFQVQMSLCGPVAVEPGYLVGYRKHAAALSNDRLAMLKSKILALLRLMETVPSLESFVRTVLKEEQVYQLQRRFRVGNTIETSRALADVLFLHGGLFATDLSLYLKLRQLRRARRNELPTYPAEPTHFFDMDPDALPSNQVISGVTDVLERLAHYDRVPSQWRLESSFAG
jgi:glycosyltransferase involved in cell wall biosynthesis